MDGWLSRHCFCRCSMYQLDTSAFLTFRIWGWESSSIMGSSEKGKILQASLFSIRSLSLIEVFSTSVHERSFAFLWLLLLPGTYRVCRKHHIRLIFIYSTSQNLRIQEACALSHSKIELRETDLASHWFKPWLVLCYVSVVLFHLCQWYGWDLSRFVKLDMDYGVI